jgi:hypothetical protein
LAFVLVLVLEGVAISEMAELREKAPGPELDPRSGLGMLKGRPNRWVCHASNSMRYVSI